MTFYDEMQGVATEILGEFKQGIIKLVVPGSPVQVSPPLEPWQDEPVGEPIAHILRAVVKGIDQRFVDGTTVLASDKMVTFAVPPVTPTMAHRIDIDGDLHAIEHIEALPAAGTTVAYRARVRA
jgi:hypothetical protein